MNLERLSVHTTMITYQRQPTEEAQSILHTIKLMVQEETLIL
jgi:hypothetical protein